MSVETFLSAVLPTQGYRFILVTFGTQGAPDFRPVQKAFAPGDETNALGFAQWGDGKGGNAYFASAGFLPQPLDENGKPKGGRTGDRATHLRSLRLDIDCGPGKAYPSKREGVQALVSFINQYALPQPWLIDSGYGLHVYWPFHNDVPAAEWKTYADRLAAACSAAGLDVDTTATLDVARVLRVPGTQNHKHSAPAPVRILLDGVPETPERLVANFPRVTQSFAVNGAVPQALRGAGDELTQNLHTPYTMQTILQQCPGMLDMVNTAGANAREPLWKVTLDLIWKSDDDYSVKEHLARSVSSGHPGFDEASFQLKWQQVQQQDYHPPTCKAIEAAGCQQCATCPMRTRISSPLVLGRPQPAVAPSTAAVPMALPAPQVQPALQPAPSPHAAQLAQPVAQVGVFRMVGANRVEVVDGPLTHKLSIIKNVPHMKIIVKGTGDEPAKEVMVPILQYQLLEVERLLDANGGKSLTAVKFNRGLDLPVRVELSNGELTDARAFHSTMHGCGIYMTRKEASNLLEVFMPEFLAQLQRARAANHIAARCGWTDDYRGFVLGTTKLTAAGVEHVRPGLIADEMAAYHSAGNEDAWRRAMAIVLAGGPDRQAVVALAIASPLMAFTGLDGVMLNAYSPESGIGKSTLGDAALSVWGSPDQLRKSARDTVNATWRIAGVTGNLPMVIDEFTNVEGKALSDFVYTVTQGREKHRLTSDAKLQAGGAQRWCLAAITTANNSVHDKLQAFRRDAVAEATRVFDLRLHPLQVDPALLGTLKADLAALRTNYGFAGPQLASVFLQRSPDKWRELVAAKIMYWDERVAKSTSDRFRSATAALIEIGAALGTALGLPFDMAQIAQKIEDEWSRQLDEFENERVKPEDFVRAFFDEYMRDFLVIGNAGTVSAMPHKIRGEIRVKTVQRKDVPHTIMIPLELLRSFIREKNGNYKSFVEWARRELGTGVVTRMGQLLFLEGNMQAYRTNAIEFSASMLGVSPTLSVVSDPALPTTPARGAKQ